MTNSASCKHTKFSAAAPAAVSRSIHFAAGFSRLPGKLVLCIRRSPEQDDITYGRTMEYWRGNQLFFRSLFEYKHPTEE